MLFDLLDLPANAPRDHVRRAYLRALLSTHPDVNSSGDAAAKLMDLREAWERYCRQPAGARDDGGFTAFGVGCGFDDSEEEQRARSELQEQASRGVMNQRVLSSVSASVAEERQNGGPPSASAVRADGVAADGKRRPRTDTVRAGRRSVA